MFAAFFEQSRVPDVLPLVAIGLIIGPIMQLATLQHFGQVGPVFANLTLVIILFESGLNMKFSSLRKSLAPAAILGFVGFALSVAVVFATTKHLFKLPDISALILGTILGGTAASIAVPLLKHLKLQDRAKTALLLESVLGNVLSIVVTLGLMTAVGVDKVRPGMVLGQIAASFILACIIGATFAYLWSSLLNKVRTLSHAKFTTAACVCISYGVAEYFGFSGMLSALAFGIVMGNAEKLPSSKLSASTSLRPISLNDDERALFAELVFLMKTFFFVYLGISIQWFGMHIVQAGAIIVLWLFISRPFVVRLALPKVKTTKSDATTACIMIPRGLAAAVLASIALTKDIPEAVILQSIAYSVILISIAVTAIFAFLCERGLVKQPYRFLFSGYKEDDYVPGQLTTEIDETKDKSKDGQAVDTVVADTQAKVEEGGELARASIAKPDTGESLQSEEGQSTVSLSHSVGDSESAISEIADETIKKKAAETKPKSKPKSKVKTTQKSQKSEKVDEHRSKELTAES